MLDGRAPSERRVRLARLHPRPRTSRPRRPTTTSTRRRTTRPSRSSSRRSWPTRRSSRPRDVALLEGVARTHPPTPSASTSGKSSSRRSASDARLTARGPVVAAPPIAKPVAKPAGVRLRSGLLTSVLLLPAGLWYLVLLVLPLTIVIDLLVRDPGQERRLRAGVRARQLRPGHPEVRIRSSPASRWPSPGRSAACSSACRWRTSSRRAPARTRASTSCCWSCRSGPASSSGPMPG